MNKPAGGVFHVAAIDDAGVHITDVWESEDALNAFLGDRLMPKLVVPREFTVDREHGIERPVDGEQGDGVVLLVEHGDGIEEGRRAGCGVVVAG